MRLGWALWTVAVLTAAGIDLRAQEAAPAAPAAAPAAAPQDASLESQITAISVEYEQARQDCFEKLKGIEDDAQVSKIMEESYPKVLPYLRRMQTALAGHEAEPAAAAGLKWIIENHEQDQRAGKAALDALLAHHAAAPETRSVIRDMGWGWSPESLALLEKLAQDAPNRELKAVALFSLAQRLANASSGDPQGAGREQAQRAEELFVQVREEFGDVPSGKSTLGAEVEPYLFELRNLAIGMTAPEIEGTDVDGKPFKLTDYRGKVVVLDFWGFW